MAQSATLDHEADHEVHHGHGHAGHQGGRHGGLGAHEIGHGHTAPRPFARLKHLLQPERRDLMVVLVFAFTVAVLSLATPIAVEALVNTVAFGVLVWPVIVIASVLMACLSLAAAIRAMQTYVVEILQRRLFVRVVADYARRLPRLKLEAFDYRYGPELANRFFDVTTLQKSLATLLIDGLGLVVMATVGMVVLAFYHPFLLGFNIVLVTLLAFLVFALGWGGVSTSIHESHTKYEMAAWLEELLRCQRGLKFANGHRLALEKADRLAAEYVTARVEHFRIVWRQTVFALGVQVLASTALLGLGGFLVISRQLTLGQLVAAELIVTLVVASISKIGKYAATYYDLMTAAEKLGLLTDLPMERSGGEVPLADTVGLAIRVHGVGPVPMRSHAPYPNWHVEPNERVAIVGSPGTGKTTLFETICGLRTPTKGTIELDGIDIRSLSLDHLRNQAFLIERSDVFAGTILENVRVGRVDLPPSEVRTALRIVGLTELVRQLPNGLETLLAADGGPLTTSQAVRLTIARALAGQPRLLILDGVLDALDLRDCPELLPRLFDPSAPWTLLVASNNPTILERCNRVISLVSPDSNEFVPLSS